MFSSVFLPFWESLGPYIHQLDKQDCNPGENRSVGHQSVAIFDFLTFQTRNCAKTNKIHADNQFLKSKHENKDNPEF